MNTPDNPYRYEPKDTSTAPGHCDDRSGFCGVLKHSRDPENQGIGEWSLGRALLIVFCIHSAAIAAIFISQNWQRLMSDFLDLLSKLAELRNPITGG